MKEPICIACDITERMTRPKSRPGNRFFVDDPPRDPSPCLFLCRQPGSSHCLGILPTMRPTTRSAKYSLFISHGGCPPCPPMLSAAPWSWRQGRWHHAGFGEMFDGGASQRENSVADDLPDLAWVANTPRRRPDYPPLSEETPTPRYPIESTDKNFAPQTYFARSADDR